MNILTIIRGVSGSGKTTTAKRLAGDPSKFGYTKFFEADMFFDIDGKYNFDAKFLPNAHEWCRSMVAREMLQKNDVIVSNTFTQYWEIESYLKLAHANGYKVYMVHCTGEYENVHGVPADKVKQMKDRFESNEQVYKKSCDIDDSLVKYE